MHSNYSHPHPLLSPSWSYQFPHPHNKSLFHVHVFLFYFVLWPIEFSQCLLCGQGLELPIGDGWLANSVWVHKLKTMVPLPLESSSRSVVQRVLSHEPLPIQEWLLIGPISCGLNIGKLSCTEFMIGADTSRPEAAFEVLLPVSWLSTPSDVFQSFTVGVINFFFRAE